MDDPIAMMLVVLSALIFSAIGVLFLWLAKFIKRGDLD